MTFPIQLTLRGTQSSPALEQDVRNRLAKLSRFRRDVLGCRVIFEVSSPQAGGHQCDVMLLLNLPGDCIVLRHHCSNAKEGDAYHCAHQVLAAAERALAKSADSRRHKQRRANRGSGVFPSAAAFAVESALQPTGR